MKFLLATGIYPPEIGGPATVIKSLADRLRAQGHVVKVVTYGTEDRGAEAITVSRSGTIVSRYIRFFRMLRSQLEPDMVVLATDIFSVGIPLRLALLGKQNCFVLRLGGEWYWEDAMNRRRTQAPLKAFWHTLSRSRRMLAQAHYRWILKRADHIILTSALLRDLLASLVPLAASHMVTLPNQVTVSTVSPKTNTRTRGSGEPLRLMYIGRFAPVKNLPFLAHVLRRVYERGVAFSMTFIGDGEERERVASILEGIPDIHFFGALSQSAAMTHLASADLCILPSLSDLSPNSVVEALDQGIPCLVTSEHGLPRPLMGVRELSPLDVDEWVATIEELSKDEMAYRELKQAVRPLPLSASLFDTLVELLSQA